ncbi:hypothetical protein P4129_27230 [Pseudomonas aeruginosa]|nr:hypothetical protein [Pseudomonas aeruginosa]
MTEPEQHSPAALVENMLLLRREDFDELLDRAAERGAERVLSHLGLETATPRRTFASCATCWKPGAMRVARRGRPPSR